MGKGSYVGLFKIGNHKLSQSVLIFNMGPAKTCPSKKLGLCRTCRICYASKAEKLYPAVLPFRKRQEKYWDETGVWGIIADLSAITFKRKYLRFFRYNESGDFKSQADVDKLSVIADFLKERCDILTYGYTARSDLDFSKAKFIVRGSGFKGKDGETKVIERNEEKPKQFNICPATRNKGIKCMEHCVLCGNTGKFKNLRNIAFTKH